MALGNGGRAALPARTVGGAACRILNRPSSPGAAAMGLLSAIRGLFGGGRREDAALAPAAFSEEMARRVRAAAPDAEVHVVGELALEIASGPDGGKIYLENAYRMYRGLAPAEREEMIERFVRSFADATRGFEPTREAIIPIVKDRAWLDEIEASMCAQGGESPAKVFEPLNDDLAVVYAIDTPHNIAYLSPGMLEPLGVERAELRALAVRNLRGLLPGIEVQRGEKLGMVVADGNYEASLLLFDDLWAREGERLRGAMVVAVPARDLLLFADGADADAVAQLQDLATRMRAEATYALTDRLFVREGEGWRPR